MPLTFVTNVVGVTPQVKGLQIKANLPSDMTFAGVKDYDFCGRTYNIEVRKDLTAPEMTADGSVYTVKVPAGSIWYITAQNQLIAAE